jgi:hypothetical protein
LERLTLIALLLPEQQRLEGAQSQPLVVVLPAMVAALVAQAGEARVVVVVLVAIVLLVGLGRPTTQPLADHLPGAGAVVAVVALAPGLMLGKMLAAAGAALESWARAATALAARWELVAVAAVVLAEARAAPPLTALDQIFRVVRAVDMAAGAVELPSA